MIENLSAGLNAVIAWYASAGWAELAEAVFVGMSVIGQHYVSKRDVRGFFFWVFGNIVAVLLFAYLGRWMTLALYVYFLWKSIDGIRVWRELDRPNMPMVAGDGRVTGAA